MGAGQSSQDASSTTIKTSYYSLLNVERDATDDEIKRAYRRRALQLHPDRNYGKEEEATSQFADIQAAYEVLSDPQERAWYDSHEGAILRGFEDGDDGQATDAYQYGDIKITTSDDISRFVAGFALKRVDYDNVPDKFFVELTTFFEKLAKEESIAARMENLNDPEYPTFGDKDDSFEDVVKTFYAGWNGFSTTKSYFWADRWNLTEAPDRRYRRAMEKENKKERDDAIREFNDSVRSLVAFVRKRDPRYRPNFQSDSDRQQALRDAAQAQAARSRLANAQKVSMAADAIPEWAKARAPEDEVISDDEEIVEEIECVACNKRFKSEKQFEAHEKSKKHQKAIQSLKKKMHKDNDILVLDLEEDSLIGDITPQDHAHDPKSKMDLDNRESTRFEAMETITQDLDEATIDDARSFDETRSVENTEEVSDIDNSDDAGTEDEAMASTLHSDTPSISESTPVQPTQDANVPKLGKAAQKRAKRAAKGVMGNNDVDFSCVQCNASFPSRSRLFQHIKDFGHAAPQSSVKSAKSKKGKR